MHKINLITGILALTFFGYAQYHGWSLFDNVANAAGSSGKTSSSRIYHK